ncbi:MAG: DUF4846 domain-containing protein [Pricia sp.]
MKRTIALLILIPFQYACEEGVPRQKDAVVHEKNDVMHHKDVIFREKDAAIPDDDAVPLENDAAYGKDAIVIDNVQSYQIAPPNSEGHTIASRFAVPTGFKRISVDSASFGRYLRTLPLKPEGSTVMYFNGRTKANNGVYDAVVDLPIGKRDLHQCADAVMRLRAEYLYSHKKYDSIHFNFTNGFRADYSKWRNGQRISVNGNDVRWNSSGAASTSYSDFWKYLEMVFSYAGTASLEKELPSIPLEKMAIGDVFVQGGFPGHAVIVVDLATHRSTGEKVFLLAQSYMPAQEIQILKNPNDADLSPWYSLSTAKDELRTPEWTFGKHDLKRFSS